MGRQRLNPMPKLPLIVVTGADEPDQYRRLERQLQTAATEIRLNELRECDLKVRYDLGGLVSVELSVP